MYSSFIMLKTCQILRNCRSIFVLGQCLSDFHQSVCLFVFSRVGIGDPGLMCKTSATGVDDLGAGIP